MKLREYELVRQWRVVTASFFGISIGTASLYFYSIGIFIKPLSEEFGWSRGEASLGIVVGTVCSAIAAMPVGRLVDRFGSIKVAATSLLFFAICLFALGTLTAGLLSFILLTGVLSLLTVGSTPVSYSRLVVSRFDRQRGLALGLALSGPGLGALLMPPLLSPFVAEAGWRSGYIILAIIILMALPLLLLLARGLEVPALLSKPSAAVQQPSAAMQQTSAAPIMETLLDKSFLIIAFIFLCGSIGVFGTIVHFYPMLTDAGLTPARAGQLTGVIGITALVGRIIAGALLDRFRSDIVTACLWLTAALGFALLSFGGVSFAIPGALIAGFAIGAENDLMAFLCGRHFKRKSYGQAYGALYSVFLVGAAIGPALSGYLFDLNGDYKVALLTSSGLLIIAAFATRWLRRLELDLAKREMSTLEAGL